MAAQMVGETSVSKGVNNSISHWKEATGESFELSSLREVNLRHLLLTVYGNVTLAKY